MTEHKVRTGGVAAAEVGEEGVQVTDLLDRLVAIQLLAMETWETKQDAETPTAVVYVIEVTDDGGFVDHGEAPIFWQYVQKQLQEQSTDETPWVVGRITKGRRAYRIMPPTPEEHGVAAAAIDLWNASADANPDDEEPF